MCVCVCVVLVYLSVGLREMDKVCVCVWCKSERERETYRVCVCVRVIESVKVCRSECKKLNSIMSYNAHIPNQHKSDYNAREYKSEFKEKTSQVLVLT